MMNEIFQDLITEGVVSIYLDDILMFTNLLEEHRWITHLVLDCMRDHKLYLWPEKCEFEKTRIEYLGFIISHNKVEMDPVKIAGVVDWLTPSNTKEVQFFVGFITFYQRLILGFSHHVCADTPQAPSPRVDRSRPNRSNVYRSSTQNADTTTLRTCKVDDIFLSILIIATPGDLGLSHL
jgi:hypothetical protein